MTQRRSHGPQRQHVGAEFVHYYTHKRAEHQVREAHGGQECTGADRGGHSAHPEGAAQGPVANPRPRVRP